MSLADQAVKEYLDIQLREQVKPLPQTGLDWKLCVGDVSGRPYVKASCGKCKHSCVIEQLQGKFLHCGKRDDIPAEIFKEFKKRMKTAPELPAIPVRWEPPVEIKAIF